MQTEQLIQLLQQPELINATDTEALFELSKSYPYLQSVYALYLKGLKQKQSYKYNNALKITAAHTTDRSVLFDYITSETFNQNNIATQIQQNSESIKELTINEGETVSEHINVVVDENLNFHIENTKDVLDTNLFEEKTSDKTTETPISTKDNIEQPQQTPEEILNLGQPLVFDKNENHTFLEWLKIASFQPIERTEDTQIEENEDATEYDKQKSAFEDKLPIIDRFINENPRIKPVTNTPTKLKLVNNDDVLSESLMTETLAKIYLEQKSYDKAIKSYKILSLKYPEKSALFAHQIKAIEQLKAQNNL